ncbi:hypothetical protein [Cryptosporangium phraense]|uniref:Uncharacterized protein n=1 Tax=Cryptosporangium phraense TaxID=2593070 RepID=A0A545AG45_9ACTN|nr:hypothetical protein [Cryptosporangium phraense]TQS40303.1 hypothetical protein FL583_35385 [Cryptosporangium phraense]
MSAQGLAGAGRASVEPRVLAAWDAFLSSADAADLGLTSGAPGQRGHDLCVQLGLWTEHRAVHDLVTSARAGGHGAPPDVRMVRDAVLDTHRDASRAEVLSALRRRRDAVSIYFQNYDETLDLAPAVSPFGRIPLLSVLVGEAYLLAVTALDLVPCGAPRPPEPLLQAGLAGLCEVLGALAVEADLTGSAAFRTPSGGWGFAVSEDGWSVRDLGSRLPGGTVVEGEAADLLGVAAGRLEGTRLLRARRLRTQQITGLLRLAPLADLPWTPGAPLLRLP